MKSSTQQLTEGFTVSIRDKAKAERKKMLTRDLLTNTTITQQELIALKQSVLEKGQILKSLKSLKFASIKPEVISSFLPISDKLVQIALASENNVFNDAMLILVNMSTVPKFKISNQNLSKLMKLTNDEGKMEIIQSFITNLMQGDNEEIMKTLIKSGLLEYLSRRFKLIFNNSEEELSFLSFLYGILINSKYLEDKVIEEVANVIVEMNISDRDEADWIASISLAECGFDQRANKLILSKMWEFIKSTLESKKSKLIIHLLGFVINMSKDVNNYKSLASAGLFETLVKTWENRHLSIKPTIVQILVNLASVPELRKTKLFQGVFSLIQGFESHLPALKFQIGKLILVLLKLPEAKQWIVPLINLGVLHHVKHLLKNQNIIGTLLAIDSSYSGRCEGLNIHIDLEELQHHQSNTVYQWAKTVIDLYFKV